LDNLVEIPIEGKRRGGERKEEEKEEKKAAARYISIFFTGTRWNGVS